MIARENSRASIEERRRSRGAESVMITEHDHIIAELAAKIASIGAMRSRRAINLLTAAGKVVSGVDGELVQWFTNIANGGRQPQGPTHGRGNTYVGRRRQVRRPRYAVVQKIIRKDFIKAASMVLEDTDIIPTTGKRTDIRR